MNQRAIGVDGAPGGWVTATVTRTRQHGDAHNVELEFCDQFSTIIESANAHDVIVVDIPIGLSSNGTRPADSQARERLGSRRSTFFPTPVRSVLDFTDWAQANEHSKEVSGKGLSKQAWNLIPKISEVDQVWTPELAPQLFEGHPETSFAEMNSRPVLTKKATVEGRDERLLLIGEHFDDRREGNLASTIAAFPTKWRTDAIDAIALAWTGLRIIDGTAIRLGGQVDPAGRPMELSI